MQRRELNDSLLPFRPIHQPCPLIGHRFSGGFGSQKADLRFSLPSTRFNWFPLIEA